MCVTICGRFYPDEGVVAGYDNRIRVKYTAKWGVQIAGMIFQTRSSNMYRTYFPNMFSFMYLVYHNISPIKRHEIILLEYLFVFFVNMEEILQKNITAYCSIP